MHRRILLPASFAVMVLAMSSVSTGEPPPRPPAEPSSCSSYCANGEIYCPPNPLMECYFYCTQTCVVCGGQTTCFDNPPPG